MNKWFYESIRAFKSLSNCMPIVGLGVKHNKLNAAINGHSWYIVLEHTVFPLKEQSLVACRLPVRDLHLILNRNTKFQSLRQEETSEKCTRDLGFCRKLAKNNAVASF